MHTIEVKSIVLQSSPADLKDMLVVTVNVSRGKDFLDERKFMYPPETEESVFLADFAKLKATLDSDYQVGLDSKANEDAQKNLSNLQKSLTDKIL